MGSGGVGADVPLPRTRFKCENVCGVIESARASATKTRRRDLWERCRESGDRTSILSDPPQLPAHVSHQQLQSFR